MSNRVIELEGVYKDFRGDFWKKKVTVLHDVTFHVGEGEVFGLVGPNGAGKTTSIKILLGLIRPTRGSARIMGHSSGEPAFKQSVGYLPENAYYYDFLKTEEVIDFYGRLFGLSRSQRRKKTDELLGLVGLADRRGVRLRDFSKGMLQRIGIAQALVNDPKLVILDEPMSGLDPIGRKEVRDIILRLADQGKTIIFSSHILSDIEAICERVAIIVKGKVTAVGSMAELVKAKVRSVEVTFDGIAASDPQDPLKAQMILRRVADQTIATTQEMSLLTEVLAWGKAQKLSLVSVVPHKETLEDLFLREVRGAK